MALAEMSTKDEVYNYVSTGHLPTAVTLSLNGNFTGENSNDLLVFKTNILEVYGVEEFKLELKKIFKLNGRVGAATLFVPRNEKKSLLAIVTLKCQFVILEYLCDNELVYLASKIVGDFHNICSSPFIVVYDPEHYVFIVSCSEPKLKLLKWHPERKGALAMIPYLFYEENMLSITVLPAHTKPTVAAIVNDSLGTHIRTFIVDDNERELKRGPWKKEDIDAESMFILAVPPPMLGFICVTSEYVVYVNADIGIVHSTSPKSRRMNFAALCCAVEPGHLYLTADIFGYLYAVFLESSNGRCVGISLKRLGRVCQPETIVYLGNDVVFVGSRTADSVLVRINVYHAGLHLLDSFHNIGPIIHMKFITTEKNVTDYIITCSGSNNDGNLHVIHSGIGFREQTRIPLSGVKNLWGLCYGDDLATDNLIVASSPTYTKTIQFVGKDVEEITIEHFLYNEKTLCVANIDQASGRYILQVTVAQVRLLKRKSERTELVDGWSPSDDRINLAACDIASGNVLVACRSRLICLCVANGQLVEVGQCSAGHEISSVYLCDSKHFGLKWAWIGLWKEYSIALVNLLTMNIVHREKLSIDVVPRSILLCTLDNINWKLLVGLGNGSLFIYDVKPSTQKISNCQSMTLGSWPLSLCLFKQEDKFIVLAYSDRCSLISFDGIKLISSFVSVKALFCMIPWRGGEHTDTCLYCTKDFLCYGRLQDMQQLHIRRVPLGELPRMVCHQSDTSTFGVIVTRFAGPGREDPSLVGRLPVSETAQQWSMAPSYPTRQFKEPPDTVDTLLTINHFLILDRDTFEPLYAYRFQQFEECASILSCRFESQAQSYFVVSSGLVSAYNIGDTKSGRIMIFKYNRGTSVRSNALVLVCTEHLPGIGEAVEEYMGMLLVLVNPHIRLYTFSMNELNKASLTIVCELPVFVTVVQLDIRKDIILCSDVQYSISLYKFDKDKRELVHVANDPYPKWLTGAVLLDERNFILSDTYFNLYCSHMHQDLDGVNKIEVSSCYHLGQYVTCMGMTDLFSPKINSPYLPVVYTSAEGGIGFIRRLTSEQFQILKCLERYILLQLPNYGLDHSEWRSVLSTSSRKKAVGFVDGDMVQYLPNLPDIQILYIVKSVVDELNASMKIDEMDVMNLVVDMSRLQ